MNFNDQSVPGLDGVATTPTRVDDLCLRADYLGRDSEPIRRGHRVVHSLRGPGRVQYLGSLIEQRVYVRFDSGVTLYIPSGELIHE